MDINLIISCCVKSTFFYFKPFHVLWDSQMRKRHVHFPNLMFYTVEHVIRRHLLKSRFLCQLEINFIKNVMNRSLRTLLLNTPVILWKFSWEFTLSYHTLTTPILARKKEADIISVIYYFWFYFIQRLKYLYHLIISEHWWLWTFNMGFYT